MCDVTIHGFKIVAIDRNIYHGSVVYIFDNGFEVELGPQLIMGDPVKAIDFLVHAFEQMLFGPQREQLEAYGSPEVLVDESPDELDPYMISVCPRHLRVVR